MDICEADFNARKSSQERHPWEQARLQTVQSLLKKFLYPGSDSHVLDIGCGDCYVLNEMAHKFPDSHFTGVDTALTPDKTTAIESAFNTDNISISSSIEQLPPDQTFDIVTMLDVLEHIEDDKTFLKDLSTNDRLRPGGVILLTVPAFNSLFTEHDRKLNHFRRYNLSKLTKTVSQAGLSTIDSGYFFASLLLPRVLQMLFPRPETSQKDIAEINDWNSGKTLTNILKYILVSDAALCNRLAKLKIKIPGLSCYLLCQKPY